MALALLIASCTNDMDNVQALQQRAEDSPVFYATIEGGDEEDAQTKVYADEKVRVLWNADDRISLFNKYSYGYQFRFTGPDGANAGSFKLVSSDDYVTGNPLSHIYAVYPYSTATKIDNDGVITMQFPHQQTYKENSFGLGANAMVSKTSDKQLKFRNVGAYLCFKLYGQGISVRSIILEGNAGETLAGPVQVAFDDNAIPSMTFDDSNPYALWDAITLRAETPVALGATADKAVSFWMVVPTTTLSSGFTVTIIDSKGGIHKKTSTKPYTFVRNQVISMKPFALEDAEPQILPEGLYYLEYPIFPYDPATSQVNIVEAEGNAWARFLYFPVLAMIEVGPIPVNATPGSSFDASLSIYEDGILGNEYIQHFTLQYVKGGKISLASDDGYRFVIRF